MKGSSVFNRVYDRWLTEKVPPLDDRERKEIGASLRPDIAHLVGTLGREVDVWKDFRDVGSALSDGSG